MRAGRRGCGYATWPVNCGRFSGFHRLLIANAILTSRGAFAPFLRVVFYRELASLIVGGEAAKSGNRTKFVQLG